MENQMERIRMQRRMILIGIIMLFLFSGSTPGETGQQPVVPQHVVDQINERREANQRLIEYQAQREAALWEMLVDAIAKETRITDRELANTVTQAIEDASGEFGVDPWLVASLIRVESAGDPSIVSSVGAIGLTQIMPKTGAEIAKTLGMENYSTELLYDPATNVRMGTAYLRQLLNRFDGSVHAALAAYNWGPTHIAKRIKRREPLPVQYPGKILRRIPEQPKWVELANAG
jgi:soluble lytic murein transglycosylase-like protein